MIIDSHAHLNFEDFNGDWEKVTKDSLANGVWYINVGSQFQTSKKGISIAENFDQGVWAAVSLHPIHVEGSKFHPEKFIKNDYAQLIQSSKKVVAIGETGIDFFHNDNTFAKQKEVFLEHLDLCKEFNLPVIIHGRDSKDGSKSAYRAILEIIKKEKPVCGGVIHCFGGSLEEAQEFLKAEFYVGFTGIITFDKTGKLAEVIKNLPLDSILAETDSPFLAPAPYRGQRNQPLYVKYVAEKIAEIKQFGYNEVENQTFINTQKLFNLK